MTKQEFIDEMDRVRFEVFPYGDSWQFICHSLDYQIETKFKYLFSEKLGEFFALGPKERGNRKEHITCRVFALQVFEQICLEEKLYEAF